MIKEQKKLKRFRTGQVISDKMDKTVVVKTIRTYMHPRLEKTLRQAKKFKVHDPEGKAKIGDRVEFYEGRPVSKTKYMYLSRVLKQAK